MNVRHILSGLFVLLLGVSGCDSCGSSSSSSNGSGGNTPAEPEEEEPSLLGDGVLTGVVRLAPGREIPSFTRQEMGYREAAPPPPELCPPPRRADSRPVMQHEGRALEGVLVSISRETPFERLPEAEPQRRELTVRGCRLQPSFIVGRVGDSLVLQNEDDYPFMPRVTGDPFMQALMQGQERVIPLEAAGRVVNIRCAMTAACGRADVVVLGHPFFALTDAEGRFRIEGLPAGELNVHAWHPLFTQVQRNATPSASPTGEGIELVIRPREAAATPTEETPADEATPETPSEGAGDRPASEEEPSGQPNAQPQDTLI